MQGSHAWRGDGAVFDEDDPGSHAGLVPLMESAEQAGRSGGMKKLFGGLYACATLRILLREFTHGHVRQLGAVLRRFLVALAARTPLLADITERAYIDIDSLLRRI